MKRFGFLFEKVSDIDNILLAHKNASKGKGHYRDVIMVNKDVDYYCNKIKESLDNETFKTSKYKVVNKRCGNKVREIHKLPYYPDRIVHHAIMQVVEPIWEKTLIDDTYSCIKGRGIHAGVRRIKEKLKLGCDVKYCLKMDIKKFYPSIDNEVMKTIIRSKIKDKKLLRLLDGIIDSGKGLPIGNYLSQYLGNLYLSGLDHYCKQEIKAKNYFRYCDDIVILSDDKDYLRFCLVKIRKYLKEKLKLTVKRNYQIFPVDKRGIDFLGYVFYPDRVMLRKSIKKRMIATIKSGFNLKKRLASYNGWLKYCNSYNLRLKYGLIN